MVFGISVCWHFVFLFFCTFHIACVHVSGMSALWSCCPGFGEMGAVCCEGCIANCLKTQSRLLHEYQSHRLGFFLLTSQFAKTYQVIVFAQVCLCLFGSNTCDKVQARVTSRPYLVPGIRVRTREFKLADNGHKVELGCVRTKVDTFPPLGSPCFAPSFCRCLDVIMLHIVGCQTYEYNVAGDENDTHVCVIDLTPRGG